MFRDCSRCTCGSYAEEILEPVDDPIEADVVCLSMSAEVRGFSLDRCDPSASGRGLAILPMVTALSIRRLKSGADLADLLGCSHFFSPLGLSERSERYRVPGLCML